MMPQTDATTCIGCVYHSCTVVIGATVLFLGGAVQANQISQLTPLGLTRIGTLAFPLNAGTCLVMGSQLFLGFDLFNQKSCWSR